MDIFKTKCAIFMVHVVFMMAFALLVVKTRNDSIVVALDAFKKRRELKLARMLALENNTNVNVNVNVNRKRKSPVEWESVQCVSC